MFGVHRLPGIAFEAVSRTAPEALPPMDIALFAGFAAMGPAHQPVPVPDYAAFRRLFGDECSLAFDEARGAPVTTALAPAVRAFFANGGRRCWVVRIARTAELESLIQPLGDSPRRNNGIAATGRFDVTPFIALRQDGSIGAATAQARSIGSWSDALAVSARVERTPFAYRAMARAEAATTSLVAGEHDIQLDQIEFEPSAPLNVGELVQFDDVLGTTFAAVECIDGRRVRAALLAEIPLSSPPQPSPPISSSPPEIPGPATRIPEPQAQASQVTLGVRVDHGADRTVIGGIGLTRLHPNSWWKFAPDDLRTDVAGGPTLLIAAENAYFDPKSAPIAWLPWDPTSDGLFSEATRASHDGRSTLERDGLSRFDAQCFLDPALAEVGSGRLLEEAERILHVEGRRLLGVHSVLGIKVEGEFNPVSLLAVPDASQSGWFERELRAAAQPESVEPPPPHWFDHRGPCATMPENPSGHEGLDRSGFLDCSTRILPAPQFSQIELVRKPGPLELTWFAVEPGFEFVLDIARSSNFADSETIHNGPGLSRIVTLASEGFYYFRLRARLGDEVSEPAWLAVTVRTTDWTTVAPTNFDSAPLVAIQRALLRLASATGEMFALLSLPRHYRIADAVAHARELRTLGGVYGDANRLEWNERRVLSYGALHHPWIVAPGSGEAVISAPPEGAIAGVHARRTLERGAWISAANDVLREVVAVDASVPDCDWPLADKERINLVRRDPRGFLLLDSDTLSDEPEWRQINVRRLMNLLRRVALRRGTTYVFEPNDDVLRRAVERGFTELLERLFTLGAFAGATPDQAYRLAVQTTSRDRDAGRLVVEIGVAPSQPLRFLTVRLVQAGGRFTVTEEG